jgi:hypothetical protein
MTLTVMQQIQHECTRTYVKKHFRTILQKLSIYGYHVHKLIYFKYIFQFVDSVGDPDPEPGSGTAGTAGTACFWASRIRIH